MNLDCSHLSYFDLPATFYVSICVLHSILVISEYDADLNRKTELPGQLKYQTWSLAPWHQCLKICNRAGPARILMSPP